MTANRKTLLNHQWDTFLGTHAAWLAALDLSLVRLVFFSGAIGGLNATMDAEPGLPIEVHASLLFMVRECIAELAGRGDSLVH
jgi:hypothetical protein